MNRMQQLAAQRFGGSGGLTPTNGQEDRIDPVGLGGSLMGAQKVQYQTPGSTPAPGVTGVTPGAVQRRIGNSTPPSQQASGPPPTPATFNRQGGPLQVNPNQQGPARRELNAPVGNLENFLRNLQNQRSQE